MPTHRYEWNHNEYNDDRIEMFDRQLQRVVVVAEPYRDNVRHCWRWTRSTSMEEHGISPGQAFAISVEKAMNAATAGMCFYVLCPVHRIPDWRGELVEKVACSYPNVQIRTGPHAMWVDVNAADVDRCCALFQALGIASPRVRNVQRWRDDAESPLRRVTAVFPRYSAERQRESSEAWAKCC